MICIILAAGYATRLYPLTKNFPKPLLTVQGKTILDRLVKDVEASSKADRYVVISNHKFIQFFEEWREQQGSLKEKISILDDGSTENENRLGAVKDIKFAIDSYQLEDDLLVLAGDNILDFSLGGFIHYAQKKGHSCVMRHFEEDVEKLRRTGVANIDASGRVISMEEKPKEPKSNWAIPPFYYYRKEDLPFFAEGLSSGCSTDAPGEFIVWLCQKTVLYAYECPGKRYDIGNLESYEYVQNVKIDGKEEEYAGKVSE